MNDPSEDKTKDYFCEIYSLFIEELLVVVKQIARLFMCLPLLAAPIS